MNCFGPIACAMKNLWPEDAKEKVKLEKQILFLRMLGSQTFYYEKTNAFFWNQFLQYCG